MDNNRIRIIATESLGVRGLCCVVKTASRKIVIDPGIALGYTRKGLLPHPVQIAVDEIIQKRILKHLQTATDVIFSHFHGDHIPLANANPYQLSLEKVRPLLKDVNIWAKGNNEDSHKMKERAWNLKMNFKTYKIADGKNIKGLTFSYPVPHGEENSHLGKVMVSKIKVGNKNFVHASDIQLLSRKAINEVVKLKADIVLASGPPIYLPHLSAEDRKNARNNALKLSNEVPLLIIDHHLLRCQEGLQWLRNLDREANNRIVCAADVMKHPPQLLEARRCELYQKMPVKDNWHNKYAAGKVGTRNYLLKAREIIEDFIY